MNIGFEWTPDISVNNATIDTQHQELLAHINTLLAIVSGVESEETLEETIAFLDRYIAEHFLYEEAYMEESSYPDIEAHKKIHADFNEQYEIFKKKLRDSGPSQSLVLDVETYLGTWWINHIGVDDKKYALWIETQRQNV
jgi:hemerythrin